MYVHPGFKLGSTAVNMMYHIHRMSTQLKGRRKSYKVTQCLSPFQQTMTSKQW